MGTPIGIGIGLSGKLTYDDSYLKDGLRQKQQAIAAKQKEANARRRELNDIMKHTLVDDNAYHPYFRPEAKQVYAEYIDKVSRIDPLQENPYIVAAELKQATKTKLNEIATESKAYTEHRDADENKFFKNQDLIAHIEDPKNWGNRTGIPEHENWLLGTQSDENGRLGFRPVPRFDDKEVYATIKPEHYTRVKSTGPYLDKITGRYVVREDKALSEDKIMEIKADLYSNPAWIYSATAEFSNQIKKEGGSAIPPTDSPDALKSMQADAMDWKWSQLEKELRSMKDIGTTKYYEPVDNMGGSAIAKNDRNQIYVTETPKTLMSAGQGVGPLMPMQWRDKGIGLAGPDFERAKQMTGDAIFYIEEGKGLRLSAGTIMPQITGASMHYGKGPVSITDGGKSSTKDVEGWFLVASTQSYPSAFDKSGTKLTNFNSAPSGQFRSSDRAYTVAIPMFNIYEGGGKLNRRALDDLVRGAGLDTEPVIKAMDGISGSTAPADQGKTQPSNTDGTTGGKPKVLTAEELKAKYGRK